MTSKEYVIWLKGFVEACHEYAPTPKQWDALKDKLAEVSDEPTLTFPINTPNTAPIQTLPFIQPYNPSNPYTINCGSGSSGTITTTPGGGSITYATPQFVTLTTTGTAYGYPSGSTMSYTNATNIPPYTTGDGMGDII
jgi:hypothetical protein